LLAKDPQMLSQTAINLRLTLSLLLDFHPERDKDTQMVTHARKCTVPN